MSTLNLLRWNICGEAGGRRRRRRIERRRSGVNRERQSGGEDGGREEEKSRSKRESFVFPLLAALRGPPPHVCVRTRTAVLLADSDYALKLLVPPACRGPH